MNHRSLHLHPWLFAVALAVSVASSVDCGDSPVDPGVDAGSDADPFQNTDGGTCSDQKLHCSADMHSVTTCNGSIVRSCADDQGCANGTCVPACDAAGVNKGSVGCDFYAHVPLISPGVGAGCFALFVANTWSTPVTLSGEANGVALDIAKYTYLSKGSGTNITLSAIGSGGSIPPGQVGIVMLRSKPHWVGGTETTWIGPPPCGYQSGTKWVQVPAMSSDPAASAWTDPAGEGGPYSNDLGQAMHVMVSRPVSIYDMEPYGGGLAAVTDANLLLPTSTWDSNYVAVTPRPKADGYTVGPGQGALPIWNEPPVLSVVASADGTVVTIDPSVDIQTVSTLVGTPKHVAKSYNLKKGQVLQLAPADGGDLLGSIIASNKPVGVWGEQQCINIDVRYCDSAHEQIPPVRALGSEYVYARYRNRIDGRDEYPPTRITGAVDGTVLTFDPVPSGARTTLKKGESFEVRSSEPFVVSSQDPDHPFYVATYMTGAEAFKERGDPEFVGVIPAAQYLSRYVFFTDPTYPETNLVFVRKRGSDGRFHDVTLDCAGVVTGWKPVGTRGAYEWTTRDLVRHVYASQGGCDNGAHEAHSVAPFALTVWGWGTEETGAPGTPGYSGDVSYAYPAGAGVQSINAVVIQPN